MGFLNLQKEIEMCIRDSPGCSSKVPLEKNMVFYNTLEEALADGYRPCKVCMKELLGNEIAPVYYL